MVLRRSTVVVTLLSLVAFSLWAAAEWAYRQLPQPLFEPLVPIEGLVDLSARGCAECHAEIYAEWASSGHGIAATDPIYQEDLSAHGDSFVCKRCHTPLVEQRQELVEGLWSVWPWLIPRQSTNELYQTELAQEGVTCVSCHARDGLLVGPHPIEAAPHGALQSDELADPGACEGCHFLDGRALGSLQRPIMETVDEWRAYRAAGGDKRCVDCHMPLVAARPLAPNNPARVSRSHRLLGPFDPEFVRTAVEWSDWKVEVSETGAVSLSLTLFNATGHRLPTAEPHRQLVVALELLDGEGRVMSQAAHTMERPIDLHALVEVPGADTTLGPRERRSIALELPGPLASEASSLRAEIRFIAWSGGGPLARAADQRSAHRVQVLHRTERHLAR